MPWCACAEGISQSHRDLGIMVSGDPSWSSNLNHICLKAYTALYKIQRAFPSAIASLKKQLYITIVQSNLCYGSQLWHPHIKKNTIFTGESTEKGDQTHLGWLLVKLQRSSTKTIPTSSYVLVGAQRHVSNQGTKISDLDFASFSSNTSTRVSTFHKLVHNYAKTSTYRHLLQ